MAAEGSVEQFIADIDNFQKITWNKVNVIVKAVTSEFFEAVIKETPLYTGRARNNWIFSEGSAPVYDTIEPTRTEKRVDKKGNTVKLKVYNETSGDVLAKKVTNKIRRAPVMFTKGKATREYYLSNQVPYIRKIEYTGWKTKGPYRMVAKNLQKYANMDLTRIQKGTGFKI